jgi:ferric-dicitrate binding protein FerR (iron transport regulator)
MARHADSRRPPLWLEQVRGQAQGVKHEEELASQKRWEALQETDRRRLEAEAQAELAQQRKDRRTLLWGLGIAAAIAMLFLVLALVSLLR